MAEMKRTPVSIMKKVMKYKQDSVAKATGMPKT